MNNKLRNKSINKIIFTVIFFLFIFEAFAQKEYLVECKANTRATKCGECNTWKTIDFVSLYESSTSVPKDTINFWWMGWIDFFGHDVWMNVFHPDQWVTKLIAVRQDRDVIFEFHDPIGGVMKRYTCDPKPNSTTFTPNPPDFHNTTGGLFYKSVWLNLEANTYDPVEITSLSINGNSDANICVSDITDNIDFTFKVDNHFQYSRLRIHFYTKSGNDYIPLISHPYGVAGKPTTYSIPFNTLGFQDHWGEDIYYRVETRRSNSGLRANSPPGIFSEMKSVRFFRSIPTPTNKTIRQKACDPRVLFDLTLDNATIAKLNEDAASYKFRIKSEVEGLSGVFKLEQYGEINGNTITLKPGVDEKNQNITFTPVDNTTYDIQIYQNVHEDETPDYDKISCATKVEVTLGVTPVKLALTATPTTYQFLGNTYHITKKGANNGEAKLEVQAGLSGRVAHFQYSTDGLNWANISDIHLENRNGSIYFTHLGPITYYVRAIDRDGCPSINSPIIGPLKEPELVSIGQTTPDNVSCHINNTGKHNDGQIITNFSGGIGPYNAFLYKDGGTNPVRSILNINAYNYQFNTLEAGAYSLKITDKYGAEQSKAGVNLSSNPEIILTATPYKLTCYQNNSGYVSLSVQNKGTTYVDFSLTGETTKEDITTSTTTFTGLSAATYVATVLNTNGCSDVVSNIVVAQPNDIKITATGSKIAKHGGNTGTINLTIEGGTGSFNYGLYKTDLVKSGTTTKDALINSLYAGNYHVDVTDGNGCPKTESDIIVRQPNAPLSLSFTQLNVDCFGNASAEVYPVATGGWGHYQYGFNEVIYGTDTIISGLVATTATADTVFVVDSAGVTEKLPVVITEPTQLTTSVKEISHLLCFEDNTGAVELNVSGGTPQYYISSDQLNWLPGSYISGLAASPNQVIYVKDDNNCPAAESVVITQPGLLIISKDTIIDAFCNKNNGAIHTIVNGGTQAYSYQWYDIDQAENTGTNSNILTDIYSGRYKLTVTDAHQCKDSMQFPVSDIDGPKILDHSIDSVSCYNGSDGKINITSVTGGMPAYHYYLDGKETSETSGSLALGTYNIRVVDDKGCKTDEYYTVPQPNDIVISERVTQPVCYNSYDGTIETFINGGNSGYSWLWSSGSTESILSGKNIGNFTLQITDWKGCQKEKSFEIIPPAKPTAGWAETSAVLCTGNVKQLDGGNFAAYQWQKDGQVVSTNRFYTLSDGGTYTLKITTNLGCTSIDTFKLEISDHPLDAVLLLQDSAQIFELVEVIDVTWPAPDSISWYFDKQVSLGDYNEWSQQFSVEDEGIVNVTLRAWYGGCFSDSAKTITIYSSNEEISEKSVETMPLILGCKLWPNPNNGNFSLEVKLSEVSDIAIQVYHLQNHSRIFSGNNKGLKSYEIPFQFNDLGTGVYLIIVKAKNEQQSIKFVINNE